MVPALRDEQQEPRCVGQDVKGAVWQDGVAEADAPQHRRHGLAAAVVDLAHALHRGASLLQGRYPCSLDEGVRRDEEVLLQLLEPRKSRGFNNLSFWKDSPA